MWKLVTHQLDNARTLARSDKRRPREASLRRAVSTAYYAQFQALCETCARTLVGPDAPWEIFTPIFRSLEHRHVAQAFKQKPLIGTPDLITIGNAFNELQATCEWADYSPEPRPNFDAAKNRSPFVRSEALLLIDTAEKAIQILDRLDDETRMRLVTRLVTKSRR